MDYTAPDKTDGSSTWSAAEHNEMKEAVNSKLDKDSVDVDFESTSDDTVPSTLAVKTLLAGGIKYLGDINSGSNLNTLLAPGYWLSTPLTGVSWHSSFPSEMPSSECKISMLIYANDDYVNQELTLFLTNPRVFKRVRNSGTWSNWVEYTTVERSDDSYAPRVLEGTPEFHFPSGGPDWDIDLTSGSRDVGGKFTITSSEDHQSPELLSFVCTFQHERTDILSVFLTPASDLAATAVSWQIDTFSATGFSGKIRVQLNSGQNASFNYSIITNS